MLPGHISFCQLESVLSCPRDIYSSKENLQEDFDVITESPKIVKSYPPKLLWIALFVLSAPQSDI